MIQSTLLLNRINISLYTLHQLGYESLDVDKIWPAPVLSVFPITAVAEKWNSNIKQILDTTGLYIVNRTGYRSDNRGCKGVGLFLHLWRCRREPRQWSSGEVMRSVGMLWKVASFHANCWGWPWSNGFSPFGYCRMCVLFFIFLIFWLLGIECVTLKALPLFSLILWFSGYLYL